MTIVDTYIDVLRSPLCGRSKTEKNRTATLGAGRFLKKALYYIRKPFCRNSRLVLLKSNGYFYLYSYKWKNPPEQIQEQWIPYIRYSDEKTFVISFKTDYQLFKIIYCFYQQLFYEVNLRSFHMHHQFNYDYLIQNLTKNQYIIIKYIAPYIICNYFDKPNVDPIYYISYNKHTYINKFLTQITELKVQCKQFNNFINYDFKIGYYKYINKKHQRLVENTTEALKLLQKKYNVGIDILGVICEYIL